MDALRVLSHDYFSLSVGRFPSQPVFLPAKPSGGWPTLVGRLIDSLTLPTMFEIKQGNLAGYFLSLAIHLDGYGTVHFSIKQRKFQII